MLISHRIRSALAYRLSNRDEVQIHAGLHKTGSTSLQRSLALAGLLYPCRRTDFLESALYCAAINGAVKNHQVLSSEQLLGEMGDLYETARERIKFLERFDHKFRVIIYLRPHLEWHSSVLAQLIQQGSLGTADGYLEKNQSRSYFRWVELCQDLLRAKPPNTRLELRVASDTVSDFGLRIGVNLRKVPRTNVSLSPFGLVALQKLTEENFAANPVIRRSLRGFRTDSTGQFSLFSPHEQTLLKSMRGDWEAIAALVCDDARRTHEQLSSLYDLPEMPYAHNFFEKGDLDQAKRYVDDALSKTDFTQRAR